MSGVNIALVVTRNHCRAEISLNRGSQAENKGLFDSFKNMRSEIESAFGEPLIWERMDDKKSCRIKSQLDGVNIFEKEDWSKMIEYLIDASERMKTAFQKPVKKFNTRMKNQNK